MTRSLRDKSRPGFLTLDLLIGMSIVAVLAVAFIVVLRRTSPLAGTMADARAASRTAEAALADLQAERAVKTAADLAIDVRPEPGGAAVPGYVWVRVTATVSGRSADLVGLVPDGPQLRRARAGSPATREGQ